MNPLNSDKPAKPGERDKTAKPDEPDTATTPGKPDKLEKPESPSIQGSRSSSFVRVLIPNTMGTPSVRGFQEF